MRPERKKKLQRRKKFHLSRSRPLFLSAQHSFSIVSQLGREKRAIAYLAHSERQNHWIQLARCVCNLCRACQHNLESEKNQIIFITLIAYHGDGVVLESGRKLVAGQDFSNVCIMHISDMCRYEHLRTQKEYQSITAAMDTTAGDHEP